jgi:two-component system CheB/CheR fusion protein
MKPQSEKIQKGMVNIPSAEEFIIAIGASAGGLEAVHTLFDNTPTDGVSYIIIQHLSPDHKSLIAELLAKHSKLQIFEAEHNMPVKPNCVYVVPSGKNMTIFRGRLILKDRESSTPNSTIDIFFSSLAEDQGNKSVGIVLSGNGADGSKGIGAIKKVGGMVIVQDPDTTQFNSMPNSAINTGYYDYILSPTDIPDQITEYIKQRTLTTHFSDPISEKDENALLEVINIIKNKTPLDFSEYKRPTIVRRIIRRLTANNLNTIEEYIDLLKSNPEEVEILTKEFMISVTKFFRDPEAFEKIQNVVIPEIIGNKLLVDTLKVWVVGCATGEEAYSIAILIREHLIDIKKDMEVKIFASDIDKEALAKASRGVYPDSISKEVSEDRLKTFFIKEGNQYKVRDNIRNMIIFADHDIVRQPPYGKIDFISCRNLLIYLNPTLQKKIFSTLHFCLNIGGYLFLGPSEGIGSLINVFSEVDKKWKIYKNIEGNYKAGVNKYSPQHIEIKKPSGVPYSLKSTRNVLPENILEIISQSHLEESGFLAGVCLDENNKIILPFGKYEQYLLPKLFNNNLIELLPYELGIAVGTSVKKAVNSNVKIKVEKIVYKDKDAIRSVCVLVKPFLLENKIFQKLIIIYFNEEVVEASETELSEVFDKEVYASQYVIDLEHELAEKKKELQDAYHALDESNDNIQSYNEELLSGNEEMQSSNEELQSINEELNTVNYEHQLKIKELADLNDDFNNYFKSSFNSQLYVDKNLVIKKFSPVSIKQINIKESDIGRPLADISTNIRFTNLIDDIIAVINNKEINEKQIETTDGKWYSMMIVPYVRSQDNKTDGAIITFNDITEIKKSKEVIESANSKLTKINEDHDTFIYSVSHDLKVPLNNMEALISMLNEANDLNRIKDLTVPLIQSVIRLKETIHDLSDISKIEQEIDDTSSINIYEVFEEVKVTLSDMFIKNDAQLTVDLQEFEIKFSKKNLRSILLNLISNAIKYRSHDRELQIEIKSEKRDGFVVLTVKDNGLGIAKEKRDKLFSKFKRVHNLEIDVEGEGIGLYLAKKIITNAGGKIELQSKIGTGSCFMVYIPSPN